jgi:hypothetical protein
LVILISVTLHGCYSYRGGAVPHVDASTGAVGQPERVVVLTMRAESNTGGDADLRRMLERQLTTALRNAGADVRQSGGAANPDFTLDVALDARGSRAGQIASGLLSGATFLVIPGYAGLEVSLKGKAIDRGGQVREYGYADTYSLWIQLFLLPLTNSPDEVMEDLIGDMARSLTRDLQRAGVLPNPPTGAAVSSLP